MPDLYEETLHSIYISDNGGSGPYNIYCDGHVKVALVKTEKTPNPMAGDHLVDDPRAYMLIANDIISPEGSTIDIGAQLLTIGLCRL